MLTIKPVQILLQQFTKIKHWLNHDHAAKFNLDKLSRKDDNLQKSDVANINRLSKVQPTSQDKHASDIRTGQSLPKKQDRSEPQAVSHERTGQILAEASADHEPEDKMPDVLLDIPTLKIDEIKLNVDNLDAKVALRADLANLVKIDIGVQVGIAKVDLDIKGVEAQAILKVRLKQVYAILSRALETIDKNPEVLQNLLKPAAESPGTAPKDIGAGITHSSDELESGVRSINAQGGQALGSVAAEGAQGVKAQKGEINQAVGNASKGVDRAIEAHHKISEEERRKMNRIDNK